METLNATSARAADANIPVSFVTEVLASAGRLEKDDLNAKLGKLFRRIDEVKSEVYESIKSEYTHFLPYLHVTPDLVYRVDNLHDEMHQEVDKLQSEMKLQLNSSATEFQALADKLHTATYMFGILKYINDLHKLETSAKASISQGNYSLAGCHLQAMKSKLNEVSDDPLYETDEYTILVALTKTYETHMETFKSHLFESWVSHIKWHESTAAVVSQENKVHSVLSIQCSNEDKMSLENTVTALHQFDLLQPKLKQFVQGFMQYVVQPVILDKKDVALHESSILKGPTMELQLIEVHPELEVNIVLGALGKSLSFMYDHLGCIQIEIDGEQTQLMSYLQPLISDKLLELIIDESLAPAIPNCKKNMASFDKVTNATEVLQNSLCEMKFISEGENTLVEYVQNVNVLCVNKQCQAILMKARNLMTSDLHDSMLIQPEAPVNTVLSKMPAFTGIGIERDELAMTSEVKLSDGTFRLPKCQISVTTAQIVQLAYDVIFEAASENDEVCTSRLCGTIRQVFIIYAKVIPTYHKNSLIQLPQLAALHQNNCMYVAHHLLVLTHQLNAKLSTGLRERTPYFVDIVPSMRRIGTECFLKMLSVQEKQFSECLSVANGFVSVSEENNRDVAVQAVHQVLHQLELLAKVWRGILPESNYGKALGTLLQFVILEIVGHVVALEDISADDATELAKLLAILVERSPALFSPELVTDEKEGLARLMQYVSKWGQMLELQIVLNAGLMEISDRWAEGMGPLAVQFSATQVKSLIRALFQNTDRRTAVLVTIRQPVID